MFIILTFLIFKHTFVKVIRLKIKVGGSEGFKKLRNLKCLKPIEFCESLINFNKL